MAGGEHSKKLSSSVHFWIRFGYFQQNRKKKKLANYLDASSDGGQIFFPSPQQTYTFAFLLVRGSKSCTLTRIQQRVHVFWKVNGKQITTATPCTEEKMTGRLLLSARPDSPPAPLPMKGKKGPTTCFTLMLRPWKCLLTGQFQSSALWRIWSSRCSQSFNEIYNNLFICFCFWSTSRPPFPATLIKGNWAVFSIYVLARRELLNDSCQIKVCSMSSSPASSWSRTQARRSEVLKH